MNAKPLNPTPIEVNEITLLYLCKTATKKTLFPGRGKGGLKWELYLFCTIDEHENQSFFVKCQTKKSILELEKKCVEWLNY